MDKKPISKTEFARLCGVTAAAVTKFINGPGAGAVVGRRIDFNHPAAQKYHQGKTAPRPQEAVPGVDVLFESALGECRQANRWTASHVMRTHKIGYARACRILEQLTAAGHVPAQHRKAVAGPSGQSPAPPPAARPGARRKSTWGDDETLIEVPEDIEALADLTLRELIDKFGTGYRFHDWLKALKEIEAVNEKRIKNATSTGRLVSRELVERGVIDQFNSAHVRLMTDGAKAISAAVVAKHEAGISLQEIEAHVSDVVGSFIRPVKNKIERNLARVESD